jgi:hypothetical protein
VPGLLLHVNAIFTCPHFGLGKVVPTQTRVLVGANPVATAVDQFPVTGCAFTLPGPKPSPCVLIKWTAPATRVKVNGAPPILSASAGVGQSAEQAPQGSAIVILEQPRVTAV